MMRALRQPQGGRALVDGGCSPVTVSGSGCETGVLLLGLGMAILTTVDPCGVMGECGGAALVIKM